jgi:hypothetical protein
MTILGSPKVKQLRVISQEENHRRNHFPVRADEVLNAGALHPAPTCIEFIKSTAALGVYLAGGERYYINGQAVPREDLSARLRQELGHRAVWTVYFEADFDTLNMDAIYAMDTIQGLGANLVWITPKVREELQQKDQRALQRSY